MDDETAGSALPQQDWQSIETAPKDRDILVFWHTKRMLVARWINDCWMVAGGLPVNPTYWRPLPPPPGALAEASARPSPPLRHRGDLQRAVKDIRAADTLDEAVEIARLLFLRDARPSPPEIHKDEERSSALGTPVAMP